MLPCKIVGSSGVYWDTFHELSQSGIIPHKIIGIIAVLMFLHILSFRSLIHCWINRGIEYFPEFIAHPVYVSWLLIYALFCIKFYRFWKVTFIERSTRWSSGCTRSVELISSLCISVYILATASDRALFVLYTRQESTYSFLSTPLGCEIIVLFSVKYSANKDWSIHPLGCER